MRDERWNLKINPWTGPGESERDVVCFSVLGKTSCSSRFSETQTASQKKGSEMGLWEGKEGRQIVLRTKVTNPETERTEVTHCGDNP